MVSEKDFSEPARIFDIRDETSSFFLYPIALAADCTLLRVFSETIGEFFSAKDTAPLERLVLRAMSASVTFFGLGMVWILRIARAQ